MAVHVHIDKEPLVIKVPMKTYLVKFLLSKFGKNHKASKTTWLGISSAKLLTFDWSPKKRCTSKSYFTIVASHRLCEKKGFFINYDAFPEFQQNIERVFRDFMHEFIKINSKDSSHGEILNSLKKFLSYYDINEDELKLDSAYRHYTRTLKNSKNRTKSVKQNFKHVQITVNH